MTWHAAVGMDIDEPDKWPDDGGVRREAVLDHNWRPPRVVRRMGWLTCISCRHRRFLSPDVTRVRICEFCKSYKSDSGFDAG